MNWIKFTDQLPREGEVVDTKIDDEDGVRNHQTLKRQGNLMFHPDGRMYVYYTPTHWRAIDPMDDDRNFDDSPAPSPYGRLK